MKKTNREPIKSIEQNTVELTNEYYKTKDNLTQGTWERIKNNATQKWIRDNQEA